MKINFKTFRLAIAGEITNENRSKLEKLLHDDKNIKAYCWYKDGDEYDSDDYTDDYYFIVLNNCDSLDELESIEKFWYEKSFEFYTIDAERIENIINDLSNDWKNITIMTPDDMIETVLWGISQQKGVVYNIKTLIIGEYVKDERIEILEFLDPMSTILN